MRVANGNSSVGIIAPLKVYDRTIGAAKASGMGKNVDEFAPGRSYRARSHPMFYFLAVKGGQ
jgi:hypothetical protein